MSSDFANNWKRYRAFNWKRYHTFGDWTVSSGKAYDTVYPYFVMNDAQFRLGAIQQTVKEQINET